MTDEDVMRRAGRMCGARVHTYAPRGMQRKPTYRFCLTGLTAASLMCELQMYMGKRRQARIDEILRLYVATAPHIRGAGRRGHIGE
jgi:hypothetical protein